MDTNSNIFHPRRTSPWTEMEESGNLVPYSASCGVIYNFPFITRYDMSRLLEHAQRECEICLYKRTLRGILIHDISSMSLRLS
jgi:hypothetical protein